jgi:hypothetical protein
VDIKFINGVLAFAGLAVTIGIFNDSAYVCADQSGVSSASLRVRLFAGDAEQVVNLSLVSLSAGFGVAFRLSARRSFAELKYITRGRK